MYAIDLREFIYSSTGTWCNEQALTTANQAFSVHFTKADTLRRDRLMMRWGGDGVILDGPLRIRITFQAENLTFKMRGAPAHTIAATAEASAALAGDGEDWNTVHWHGEGAALRDATLQVSTIYSYVLNIPAGHVWKFTYRVNEPSVVGTQLDPNGHLGRILYDRVVIEPAGPETVAAPVATGDLPCNLAVGSYPDTSTFFPVACETCEPGAQVRMPPLSPTLSIPSAEGGCTRTRFFNGMSITKEDLETEQRYQRVKNRLHNRAMGQGVVWGLSVYKSGEHICVEPGYGIDCCGNDLTVTGDYMVETATLLRDPAAAAILANTTDENPQRMHLLLEYVECPSEPRPSLRSAAAGLRAVAHPRDGPAAVGTAARSRYVRTDEGFFGQGKTPAQGIRRARRGPLH